MQATNNNANASQKRQIGLYELEETINVGLNCVVKRATHIVTGDEVAIKIVYKKQLDAKGLSALMQEVHMMQRLSGMSVFHPYIIRLFEVIDTPKLFVIVMEYCSKGNIREYIQGLNSSGKEHKHREIRRLFKELVSAVDYCHSQNIYHRDIKCANVLVDKNNNVKLMDFGLAVQCWRGQKIDKDWPGTAPYCAPELFLRKKYSPKAVDMWALGVVLYELCLDKRPFVGINHEELRKAVIEGVYKLKKSMSPDEQRVISSLLLKDPNRRRNMPSLKLDPYLTGAPGSITHGVHEANAPHLYIDECMEDTIEQMESYSLERHEVMNQMKHMPFGPISGIFNIIVTKKLHDARTRTPAFKRTPSYNAHLRAQLKQELEHLAAGGTGRRSPIPKWYEADVSPVDSSPGQSRTPVTATF
eukprot:Nk52_evm29s307 gene=Nk52_evmTU29s307